MVHIVNLILRHKDSLRFENGNHYLKKLEISIIPRINEHIIIEQELYRVVGIFHNPGFNIEILAVYDGDTVEIHKRLFNS